MVFKLKILLFIISLYNSAMSTSLTIELIRSTRGKDKASIEGFVYTLTNFSRDVQQWVCEKIGVCKARLHARDNQVIKPTFIDEIHSSHNHGSDPARIDMLKGTMFSNNTH